MKGQAKMPTEKFEDEDGNTYEAEVETLDTVPFEPSAPLAAAISAGHVTTKVRTVEVKAKDKAGNVTKVFRQAYTQCSASNEQGALALPGIDGDESKIWDFVSSKADANAFQTVYVRLRNAAQGPEKAVEKMKKLFDGLSESQREAARKQLAELGLL